MTQKQIPLTIELFEKYLMPQIRVAIDEIVKEHVGYLPTRKEYFAREDKTMGELKKLRDEVLFTTDLYEKTNKRVNIIDKHLGIDTSVVFQ